MDEHFKNQFLELAGAKTSKATIWPMFHKALHRCRIYDRATGLMYDRSTFFWYSTNARLRSLFKDQDARYEVRQLDKPAFDVLWIPRR
jgi:hypothetical protein